MTLLVQLNPADLPAARAARLYEQVLQLFHRTNDQPDCEPTFSAFSKSVVARLERFPNQCTRL
jgi:hypothetical protein